jgi:hypothetical protein
MAFARALGKLLLGLNRVAEIIYNGKLLEKHLEYFKTDINSRHGCSYKNSEDIQLKNYPSITLYAISNT